MTADRIRTHPITLPGGARVIVLHVPAARNDSVVLALPAGMRHEQPGEEGMLHLMEHLVYQDSVGVTGAVRQAQVAASGGVLGGHTHMDYTEFYETGARGEAGRIAERLIEQVFHPALRDEQIAEQIRAVATERAHRLAPAPGGVLPWPHLSARYWADHANGHDGSGDLDLAGRADAETLSALHRRHYRPSATVLTAVTSADPAPLRDALAAALARVDSPGCHVASVSAGPGDGTRQPGPLQPAPVHPGVARPRYDRAPAARRLFATAAAPADTVSDALLGDILVAEAVSAQAGLDASAGLFGPGDLTRDDLFILVDDTAVAVNPCDRLRALSVADDAAVERARRRAVLRAEAVLRDDERLARSTARDALLRGIPGFAEQLVAALAASADRARALIDAAAVRLADSDFAALSVPHPPPGRPR